jgi:hypothetical protein
MSYNAIWYRGQDSQTPKAYCIPKKACQIRRHGQGHQPWISLAQAYLHRGCAAGIVSSTRQSHPMSAKKIEVALGPLGLPYLAASSLVSAILRTNLLGTFRQTATVPSPLVMRQCHHTSTFSGMSTVWVVEWSGGGASSQHRIQYCM